MRCSEKGFRSVKGELIAEATAIRETYCSSEEDKRKSYYQLSNVWSSKLYNRSGKKNRKHLSKEHKRKRVYSTTNSSSSEDQSPDYLQSATVSQKRQSEASSNIEHRKKIRSTLSRVNRIQDSSNTNSDNNIPSQKSTTPHVDSTKENCTPSCMKGKIQDMQKTSNLPEQCAQDNVGTHGNCVPEFRSCLIQALDNIKETFTVYDSRLDHLKRKYFENESVNQDDIDNVMFLFSCIMSKLKEDLDREQNNFNTAIAKHPPIAKNSAIAEHSAIASTEVAQQSDELGKNNKVIDRNNGHGDVHLRTEEATRKDISFSDSSDSVSSKLSCNEKTQPNLNAIANCFTKLPLLNHLSEITIVNGLTKSKSSKAQIFDHEVTMQTINKAVFAKPPTKYNVDDPKHGDTMQIQQKSGYDSDMSTCSTVICSSRKAENTSGIINRLRSGTPKPHFTRYNTTPKNQRRTPVISRTPSLDGNSTDSNDSYQLRFSLEPTDFRTGCPAISDNKSNSRGKKGDAQFHQRRSPVLVDLNTIDDIDYLYSEEEVADTAPKFNKTIMPRDKKLQMNCFVQLSRLKVKVSRR